MYRMQSCERFWHLNLSGLVKQTSYYNWLVLSDEQKMPIFPTKWRATEQLAGGWAVASQDEQMFVALEFLSDDRWVAQPEKHNTYHHHPQFPMQGCSKGWIWGCRKKGRCSWRGIHVGISSRNMVIYGFSELRLRHLGSHAIGCFPFTLQGSHSHGHVGPSSSPEGNMTMPVVFRCPDRAQPASFF